MSVACSLPGKHSPFRGFWKAWHSLEHTSWRDGTGPRDLSDGLRPLACPCLGRPHGKPFLCMGQETVHPRMGLAAVPPGQNPAPAVPFMEGPVGTPQPQGSPGHLHKKGQVGRASPTSLLPGQKRPCCYGLSSGRLDWHLQQRAGCLLGLGVLV